MLTRCPACATTFCVRPEQLKAKLGRVRCGHCQSVFNALDSLIEEAGVAGLAPRHRVEAVDEDVLYLDLDLDLSDVHRVDDTVDFEVEAALTPASVLPAPERVDVAASTINAPEVTDEAADAATEPDAGPASTEAPADLPPQDVAWDAPPLVADAADVDAAAEPSESSESSEASEVSETPDAADAPSDADTTAAYTETTSPLAAQDPYAASSLTAWLDATGRPAPEDVASDSDAAPKDTDPAPEVRSAPLGEALPPPAAFLELIAPPPPRRWPWVIGTLLLLALLAAQLALIYRVELTVLWPEARPLLSDMCAPLACEVGLPARPDLLGIDASDLHPGKQAGRLQLAATLKNRAPFVQEYPNLELTLTDLADRPLIVRSLKPADYLPAGKAPGAGFAAQGELAVSLDLDVGTAPAVGYRLYLYYP